MRKNNNSNRKEKMEQIKDKLIKGTQAIYDSGLWKEYLTAMSKFTDYSINNCILIVSQCPQASLVCGFKKWKNEFNRNVIKGEKGIMIFAPCTKKIEVSKTKTDKDGNQKEETSEEKYTYFRPCYVFDVSQTEGDPLPSIATKLEDNVDNYNELKESIINIAPVPVSFEDVQGEANGYYSPSKQKIVVQKGMSELQTIKTLLHEIAHATLKHGNKEDKLFSTLYSDYLKVVEEYNLRKKFSIPIEHKYGDVNIFNFDGGNLKDIDICGEMYTNCIDLLEKGKYYKDYEEMFLGYSDIASLIVVTCDHKRGLESNILKMGSDGQYFGYLCNNAEIGEHYTKKYECDGWLVIYDDNKKMFNQFGKFEIYRAGDFGIIINKIQ